MSEDKIKYYIKQAGELFLVLLALHALGVHIPFFSNFVNYEVYSFNHPGKENPYDPSTTYVDVGNVK